MGHDHDATTGQPPGVGHRPLERRAHRLVRVAEQVDAPVSGTVRRVRWLEAADHGGFRAIIDKAGLVSMQLFDVRAPEAWCAEDGSVGVLLNTQDTGASGVASMMSLPLGDALAVNVKLLTPDELAYAAQNGATGRAELGRRFAGSGEAKRSSLSRRSTV